MKHLLSAVVCALLACAPALAQKAPIKFGDIPMDDMKMTVYPKDSSAEAVVLCDYGTSTIDYSNNDGFVLNFERIRRVKILTKDGLKHAELSIPLYHVNGTEERISGLKVVTYNLENGKVIETKAKNDSFFKEEFNKNTTLMKVASINVKEGSVIEFAYKVKSEFVTNFQDWQFQSEIPARWSEYRAEIPEYFNYQKFMQGYIALDISENSSKTGSLTYSDRSIQEVGQGGAAPKTTVGSLQFVTQTFRWATKDVPAFRMEPYMTTANDYIAEINFELAYTNFPGSGMKPYMGTWDDISKTYWQEVGTSIKSGDFALKDELATAISGATTDEEKVARIFDYVRYNVNWDENYRMYPTQQPRKTVDTKKGTSADINILLASMIEKTGIPVFPVLLSTRNHGFVRETAPLSTQFNYVICAVQLKDKVALLDATTRMLPFGVIPERCLNGQGFVVTPEGWNWIPLKAAVKSRTTQSIDMKLSESGEVDAKLTVDKTGYHSAKARNQYISKGEGDYVKEFASPLMINVSKTEFANVNDVNQPFKETYHFTAGERASIAGGIIYFNPFVIGRPGENPFKSADRIYPVDFGNTYEEFYMAKIAIPDGYTVEELPQNKVFALPENAGRYTYNVVQNGNILNLTSILAVNRPLFTQNDYPHLREFFNLVIAKQAEQIVLKKK
ncbi:MAG: transglutaminase domain-containing protein [Bacteroidota bacterium]